MQDARMRVTFLLKKKSNQKKTKQKNMGDVAMGFEKI